MALHTQCGLLGEPSDETAPRLNGRLDAARAKCGVWGKWVASLWIVAAAAVDVAGEPEGIHMLTSEEKTAAGHIQEDMEKCPDLYQGESLSRDASQFKKENHIGKRTLSSSDVLVFPETRASMKSMSSGSFSDTVMSIYKWTPPDPNKGLKDYAGTIIIGSPSSVRGESSVLSGTYAERSAELHLKHCDGLQVQVYPAFRGSWPIQAPSAAEDLEFNAEGVNSLVNWGLAHGQETLHHLMIGPNMYFPEWFRTNEYTAEELDRILKKFVTTLMVENDNKRKMGGWNIFNELLEHGSEDGGYKKDGVEKYNCVWMRMGFEPDQSGLMGSAKVNQAHPVIFRKALEYASMASGELEIRDYGVAEINRKSDALYQLVKHLLNSGVRVDAVGFQCHLKVTESYDWESIKENIRRFKALGLGVFITELDVSMGSLWDKEKTPIPEDYEQLQIEHIYGLIKAAREAEVERIDFWGLTEAGNKYWLVGQQARLFDEEFQPRMIYKAALKALCE